MHHRAPAKIPQRVIDWWKARSGKDSPATSVDDAAESGNVTTVHDRETGLGGRARSVAGGVQSRGKGAVEELKRRRQGESGTATGTDSGSGASRQSASRIGDRAKGAASGAGTLARDAVNKASAMRSSSRVDQPAESSTAEQTPSNPAARSGPESEAAGTQSDSPSVAWASTAGVIDPELSNPSAFVEAEQRPASGSARDSGDPETTPGDRAAATPHVDTTAQVAGNAEEGTRNEAASAATQARTNTAEDKPLVQVPDDPIGDSNDRTPGTGSVDASSEPFAYSSSGEAPTDERGDAATVSEMPAASAPSPAPPSSAGKISFARRGADPDTTRREPPSARDVGAETRSADTTRAPVGDDGLPIYFDTDDRTRSAAQSSDLAGLGTMSAPATSQERHTLGANMDDGSSITELEAEGPGNDPAGPSQSTTLSGDAYRSTAAPEAVIPDGDDAGDVRHPEPGSSIPDFATDADTPTRTVESPGDSGGTAEPNTRQGFGSIVSQDPDDERPAGSGVTTSEPTSRIPGDAEPVPDPASGRARAAGDIGRRGTSGLGAKTSGSSRGGSSEDLDVADVVSTDDPGMGMEASDAVTQQDAAGAVDTSDPEGISRSITRDTASMNEDQSSTSRSGGRTRRRRKGASDERSGR